MALKSDQGPSLKVWAHPPFGLYDRLFLHTFYGAARGGPHVTWRHPPPAFPMPSFGVGPVRNPELVRIFEKKFKVFCTKFFFDPNLFILA